MTHSEAMRLITIARNRQGIPQRERGRGQITCERLATYAGLVDVEIGACCD